MDAMGKDAASAERSIVIISFMPGSAKYTQHKSMVSIIMVESLAALPAMMIISSGAKSVPMFVSANVIANTWQETKDSVSVYRYQQNSWSSRQFKEQSTE